ncbi:MAG: GAF domain-containing protein, partial [Coleofasciculus sp. C2-GNP5-27]
MNYVTLATPWNIKFIHNEALANELAARFWLEEDKADFAQLYIKNAHYGYKLWGAKRKVEELETKYPKLLRSPTEQASVYTTFNRYTTSESTRSELLDLATTLKSAHAISSEIILDKLLANLMNILVENAGAQRGILILPSSKGLLVEATKEADSEEIPVLQSIPLDQFERLSLKIVHYVARTCKTVVLNDATREDNFANDPYIQQYHCLSIACTPLINQGRLQGIIYLENNLITGAFTEQSFRRSRCSELSPALSASSVGGAGEAGEAGRVGEAGEAGEAG